MSPRSVAAAFLAVVSLALVGAQASAQVRMPKDSAWDLRLPTDASVTWRGARSVDGAGASGSGMLYPAPNAAGLIAAILTHAAIASTVQSEQERKAQEAADQVLKPYLPVLGAFQHGELGQKALTKLSASGRLLQPSESPAGWVVESAPLFQMTQDQRALILDNAVTVYAPGESSKPAYQNVVRVLSAPQAHADLPAFWNAEQGTALKEQTSSLLASSLELALLEATGGVPDNAPQRTFRFAEGGAERMERAQLIREDCDRLLIKNLRGWLMSVPARAPGPAC